MKFRRFTRPFAALTLVFTLGVVALADVIRMKDGQVIRGQIVGFRDQQFTVLIGSGSGGRRSRITLYMEDVESIEFDGAGGAVDDIADTRSQPPARTSTQRPSLGNDGGPVNSAPITSQPRNTPTNTGSTSISAS
jgi:hypothetical protein